MSDILVNVESVSKKFCRSLKRSLWYGLQDLNRELRGNPHDHTQELRSHEFWALQDISFNLARGETLGLIGPNGAGKTTLLRMLNGLIKPDRGRIEIRGRMQALIALGAGFNPILTGRENIFVNASVLGLSNAEIRRRLDDIVAFSGVADFIDAPVQSYSSGMTVRLGFAVAAHLDPEILLVDEVLAVGDEGFQLQCFNKIGDLRAGGTAIILVSHNMHTVSTFSSRALLMRPGGYDLFDQVSAAVNAYKSLFRPDSDLAPEKICTGTADWEVLQVDTSPQTMSPGDSFSISIRYRGNRPHANVEVDIGIRSDSETGWHFQATNRAYGQPVSFQDAEGVFRVVLQRLAINNSRAQVAIAIWTHGRERLLFWWRIPIVFAGIAHATGNVFYDVSYSSGHDTNAL